MSRTLIRTIWYLNVGNATRETAEKRSKEFHQLLKTMELDLGGKVARENIVVPVRGQETHAVTTAFEIA